MPSSTNGANDEPVAIISQLIFWNGYYTACMGLSLSRGRHAHLVVLCIPFFCSTRAASTLPSRPHISIAVAAQRRSRTALLQRRRRLVLDGREHRGRLPAIGWLAVR